MNWGALLPTVPKIYDRKFVNSLIQTRMQNLMGYIFGTVGSRAPQFIKSSYIIVVYKWFEAWLNVRQKYKMVPWPGWFGME